LRRGFNRQEFNAITDRNDSLHCLNLIRQTGADVFLHGVAIDLVGESNVLINQTNGTDKDALAIRCWAKWKR